MSFAFHFYVIGLTSWTLTSPSKWISYEGFNLERWVALRLSFHVGRSPTRTWWEWGQPRSNVDGIWWGSVRRCQLHWTWYLVSYGILCHHGNFLDDASYEKMNKYCHGWWMSSSIGQTCLLMYSPPTLTGEGHHWMVPYQHGPFLELV